MTHIIVKSKVGSDGVLHVNLPSSMADKEVQVTVAPLPESMTPEEWRAQVMRAAGSITDPTFQRHPQGEPEEREPLS